MKIKIVVALAFAAVLVGCGNESPAPDVRSNIVGLVEITGVVAVDETLTATVIDGDGTLTSEITYQWAAGGVDIVDATDSTFTITFVEAGETITVTATYRDDRLFDEIASETTSAVPEIFNSDGSVDIAGTVVVDQILTATVTDGDGTTTSTIAYQWAASGTDIAGATDSTYVVNFADIGETITVIASYTDDRGFDETLVSAATSVVPAVVNSDGLVVITGAAAVDATLTATVTDGDGTTTSAIAYQWAAGGVDIDGATALTYIVTAAEIGETITVAASYIDDRGFTETPVSEATLEVPLFTPNVTGTVDLSGTLIVGSTLSAMVTDANGTTDIAYQWQADGTDIVGATSETYTLTAAERGATVSVIATYTDNNGFSEEPIDTATDIVYTVIVDSEVSLLAAAADAVDGDVIGIASAFVLDDYVDMDQIDFVAPNLLIRLVPGSTAVISGEFCLTIGGDGTVVDGLVFDDLAFLTGGTCLTNAQGNSSIYLFGDRITFRNNQMLGDDRRALLFNDQKNYIFVDSFQSTIERNRFEGRDTSGEGAAIAFLNDAVANSAEENIVQYNLFKDFETIQFPGVPRGIAYAIQIGLSGNSVLGMESGSNIVRYNRFDDVATNLRLMRVDSSNNEIMGNTFVNSQGNISIETGTGNIVSENIIIAAGDSNIDGGISFAPLGNTITNNFIANIATTDSTRGPLVVNHNFLLTAGPQAIIADVDIDKTNVVSGNTILNSTQAIVFDDGTPVTECEEIDAILDFDNNLIANETGNTLGDASTAVQDLDYLVNCNIDPTTSDFDNNHFYAAIISQSSLFDFNGALPADGNITGVVGGASLTVVDTVVIRTVDGIELTADLVNGSGINAGIGVDTSTLNFITEDQVGPGSTWVAP